MQTRQLLSDGTQVGAIGLGCMSFGGFYGPTSEKEAHETLAVALDLGVTYLDTANIYGGGVSESFMGSFFKGNTRDFKIATKASISSDPETGARCFNNRPEHLRAELEKSLNRLTLERVDLFYIHRRDPDIPIEDVMGTLAELKHEGKIGGIGFSEISPASLKRACAVGTVDAVQNEYSLWSRMPDLGLIEACKTLGVSFVPFSPLGRGIFAKEAPDPSTFEDVDFRKNNPRFVEPNFSHNVKTLQPFKEFAADHNLSPAALALAWCLAQGDHLIPIPGTRTRQHLQELASGADITMTDEILKQIDELLPVGWAHGDRYSRAQWFGPEGYC